MGLYLFGKTRRRTIRLNDAVDDAEGQSKKSVFGSLSGWIAPGHSDSGLLEPERTVLATRRADRVGTCGRPSALGRAHLLWPDRSHDCHPCEAQGSLTP